MDIILHVKSVLKDASQVTIEDNSTYTTPARADLHSVFHAFKVDELENTTPLTVVAQGDPVTAAEWQVETPQDGYHRFTLIQYPKWVGGAYVTDQVVAEDGVLYIAAVGTIEQPSTSIGVDWNIYTSVIEDEDNDDNEAGTLNCILFYRIKTCFAKEVARVASIACMCDVDKKPLNIQKYERLGVLVDGIAVDGYQTRYTEGEKKVQYTTKIC